MNIDKWGWNRSWEEKYEPYSNSGMVPARVTLSSHGIYTLACEKGTIRGRVSGAYSYRAVSPSDYPAVGDWVLCRTEEDEAIIEIILERKGAFSRNAAGEKTEQQVIASNVDRIFLVFGLDGGRNFNARSLERYSTLAWDSGAEPVIILNKVDLATEEERESALLTAENSAPASKIHMVSASTGEGIENLTTSFKKGETIVLAGPSGVGKSTLINALFGGEIQATGGQRKGDKKGKHTTTGATLLPLPSGTLLIDSPGLKELQLWADESALEEAFEDVANLAEECRFRDCHHEGEPGCAVQEALATGELDQMRFMNYLELKKELGDLKSKQERNQERKESGKNLSKIIRQMKSSPIHKR